MKFKHMTLNVTHTLYLMQKKNNFNAIRSTTIAKPAILVLNLSQICASINTRVGKMRIFIFINIRILHVVTSADPHIRIIPPA